MIRGVRPAERSTRVDYAKTSEEGTLRRTLLSPVGIICLSKPVGSDDVLPEYESLRHTFAEAIPQSNR